MNILVIGNGFDLAHGLPTKYTDFLKFVGVYIENRDIFIKRQSIKKIWTESNNENRDRIISFSILHEHNNKVFLELDKLISNNVWIEYFMSIYEERIKNGKDGWIDFESEISNVIQSIDQNMGQGNFYSHIILLQNEFLNYKYTNNVPEYIQATAEEQEKTRKPKITYQKLRDILLEDLNKLIRALEIYLTDFVEKIGISKISKDIKELDIDHVLSFNYTNTFEELYGQERNIEYDYIHGKAGIKNIIESNNMVLGIDEYLSDDRKNNDIEFIAFKKFYQRIYKETGCKYKEWVDQIERNEHMSPTILYKLYIFGHSLDVTDKDILRDLILHDNVHTTIFYHNKDVMGQQIANLVKVIGQDKLIKRTGGSTKTIEFRQQQDMLISSSTVIY